MIRSKILKTALEGAQAIASSETPANTGVDNDLVALNPEPETKETADDFFKLDDDSQQKLDEVQKLQDAQDKLEGNKGNVAQEDLWLHRPVGVTKGQPAMSFVEVSHHEKALNACVLAQEGLIEINKIGKSLGQAGELISALESLDTVINTIEKPTPTEAALIQAVGDAIVSGTDVDPAFVTPAMESEVDSSDRRGLIRRIVDKALELIRRFVDWLKTTSRNILAGGVLQDERVNKMKKAISEVKPVKINAPKAIGVEPLELPAILINENTMVGGIHDIPRVIQAFEKQYDELGSYFVQEMNRLQLLVKAFQKQQYIKGELLIPIGLSSTTTTKEIVCYPAQSGESVTVGEISFSPTDSVEFEKAADFLKTISYERYLLEIDEKVKLSGLDFQTLEKFADLYFKSNDQWKEVQKKTIERLEGLTSAAEFLKSRLLVCKNTGDYGGAVLCLSLTQHLAEFNSAVMTSMPQIRASFTKWIEAYINHNLQHYVKVFEKGSSD